MPDIVHTDGRAYTDKEGDPSELVGDLYNLLWQKADYETKPIMRAQYAWLAQCVTNREFGEIMYETFNHRKKVTPLYIANVALRASNLILKRNIPAYPSDKDRSVPEAWFEEVENGQNSLDILLENDKTTNIGDFSLHMRRDITTTQERRGIPLIAAMQLFTGKNNFSYWDMGSSQGYAAIQAARHREKGFRYLDTQVVRLGRQILGTMIGKNRVEQLKKFKIFNKLSRLPFNDNKHFKSFNKLVQDSQIEVTDIGCIDILYLADPAVQEWAKYSSHYTDELSDERLAEFEAFQSQRPENVRFYDRIDITARIEPGSEIYKRLVSGGKKSAAFYSFILHQLRDEEEREAAIQNGLNLTEDDGWLFILDAVDISEEGTMKFADNREPFNVSFWGFDKQRPELGWQKLFDIDSGRIKKVQLTESTRRLLDAKYPRWYSKIPRL